MVLLHLLIELRKKTPFEFMAIHVDHQLRPESSQEAISVQKYAEKLGVFCKVHSLPKATRSVIKQEGLEAWARRMRYEALGHYICEYEINIVATAHHLKDHRENFWMRLLEGKSIEQCGRFCDKKRLQEALLWRPLLQVEKKDLLAFQRKEQVVYFEDPSNQNLCIRRNLLRNQILPMLSKMWPLNFDSITDSLLNQSHAVDALYRARTLPLGKFCQTWWGGFLFYPFASLLPSEWAYVLREAKKSGFQKKLGVRYSVIEEILRQREQNKRESFTNNEKSGFWYCSSEEKRDLWSGWACSGNREKELEPLFYLDKNRVSLNKNWSIGSVSLSQHCLDEAMASGVDVFLKDQPEKETFSICSLLENAHGNARGNVLEQEQKQKQEYVALTLLHNDRCCDSDYTKQLLSIFVQTFLPDKTTRAAFASEEHLTGKQRLVLGFLLGKMTFHFPLQPFLKKLKSTGLLGTAFSQNDWEKHAGSEGFLLKLRSNIVVSADSGDSGDCSEKKANQNSFQVYTPLSMKEIQQALAKAKVAPQLRGLFPYFKICKK